MARFFARILTAFVLLVSACTSQYSVRDIETGRPLATRYERRTPFSHEVTIGCSKQQMVDAGKVQVDCSGYGLFHVPSTMAERYWNAGAGSYQFPGYFLNATAQPIQAPHPHTAAMVPQDAAAAQQMQPGWYQHGAWVFDQCGRPQYSPQTRVIHTHGGTHLSEPPRPQCWDIDRWGSGKKFWTGQCGWLPPTHPTCG